MRPLYRAKTTTTRSQAVARIADRMSHSTFGGHVTSSVHVTIW